MDCSAIEKLLRSHLNVTLGGNIMGADLAEVGKLIAEIDATLAEEQDTLLPDEVVDFLQDYDFTNKDVGEVATEIALKIAS